MDGDLLGQLDELDLCPVASQSGLAAPQKARVAQDRKVCGNGHTGS